MPEAPIAAPLVGGMAAVRTPEKRTASALPVVHDWGQRSVAQNNAMLREAFRAVLAKSATLPPEQRLIMYDANDGKSPCASLGSLGRKRLDPRRNTKPKKPEQANVCTPFDPNGFNFSRIRNPEERLLRLEFEGGTYEVLTNKFPLFERHMLLVCTQLVPQQLTLGHLLAITELLRACSFCAYFNSWCASASVNHFHCHLIDELPPVAALPLTDGPVLSGGGASVRAKTPAGFPGVCHVLDVSEVALVHSLVLEMQRANQPHNLLFTPSRIYVWPKPLRRPERSFELYPETVGGPELLGSLTVYDQACYDELDAATMRELLAINTAELPPSCLPRK